MALHLTSNWLPSTQQKSNRSLQEQKTYRITFRLGVEITKVTQDNQKLPFLSTRWAITLQSILNMDLTLRSLTKTEHQVSKSTLTNLLSSLKCSKTWKRNLTRTLWRKLTSKSLNVFQWCHRPLPSWKKFNKLKTLSTITYRLTNFKSS